MKRDVEILLLHDCPVECKRGNANPEEKDMLDEVAERRDSKLKLYDKDCICLIKPSETN